MEFGVLGPVEAWHAGDTITFRRPRQRCVLAMLLLDAGRVVSIERLIQALWVDRPPANARMTVQGLVWQLRETLGGPLADRLVTRSPGYLLDIPPRQVDLHRFRDLVAGARPLLEQDDEHAATRLREALRLWRGTPGADTGSDWLQQNVTPALEEERLAALALCLDAELRLGRHAALIPELSALVTEFPLREHLSARLMLALYRAGQPAQALEVYRQLRARLADELGLDPGAEVRGLEAAILRGDPGLAQTRATTTRTGDPPAVPPRPRQLPAAPRRFVGRDAQIRRLTALLDRAADGVMIYAVHGTAGIGKTTLALHLAHQVADRFPDGQLYVNLRGFDPTGPLLDPVDAIEGFLTALGVPAQAMPAGADARAALYRSLLADKRVLVVLDNARDTTQVRPLLPGAGAGLVLITSRNRLDGLAVQHGAHHVDLGLPSAAEARALLGGYLDGQRMDTEAAAVEQIIQRCARLPLALSIAGARAAATPDFPLRALATDLDQAHARLDALNTGDTPETDIRAVFSWSYRALPEAATHLFRLLGVHPGPDISLAAATALAGTAQPHTRTHLHHLTRAHLLEQRTPDRYQFHDLMRVYATEQAADLPEPQRRDALHRVLDFYLHTGFAASQQLAPHWHPIVPDVRTTGMAPQPVTSYREAAGWFTAERATLLAVIRQAAASGFDVHAWQLPWALSYFLDGRGRWHEYVDVQQIALAAADRLGDRFAQAHAHSLLGRAHSRLRQHARARPHARQALRLFGELGNADGQAHAHMILCLLADDQGRYAEALAHSRHALQLYRSTDNRAGHARALNGVGWSHAQLGDYQQALTFCRQSQQLFRDLGDRDGEASALDSLGYAHARLGQHEQAIDHYRSCLALYQELPDRSYPMAVAFTSLGNTYHAAGDRPAARDAWHQALGILDDLGHSDADQIRARLAELTADR